MFDDNIKTHYAIFQSGHPMCTGWYTDKELNDVYGDRTRLRERIRFYSIDESGAIPDLNTSADWDFAPYVEPDPAATLFARAFQLHEAYYA